MKWNHMDHFGAYSFQHETVLKYINNAKKNIIKEGKQIQ